MKLFLITVLLSLSLGMSAQAAPCYTGYNDVKVRSIMFGTFFEEFANKAIVWIEKGANMQRTIPFDLRNSTDAKAFEFVKLAYGKDSPISIIVKMKSEYCNGKGGPADDRSIASIENITINPMSSTEAPVWARDSMANVYNKLQKLEFPQE
jgi:hypothetical protein